HREELSLEVDVDLRVELRFAHIRNLGGPEDTRVEEQQIERSEFLPHPSDEIVDVRDRAAVGAEDEHVVRQLGASGCHGVGVSSGYGDPIAALVQESGGRPADAGGSAGDQCGGHVRSLRHGAPLQAEAPPFGYCTLKRRALRFSASGSTMTATTTAVRADARRNRNRLISVAAEAFAAEGAVSLDAIAKRAGVGIGTLYRHFPTKEDLVEEVYRDEVRTLRDDATALLAVETPTHALRLWMLRFSEWARERRGVCEALVAMSATGRFGSGPVCDEV